MCVFFVVSVVVAVWFDWLRLRMVTARPLMFRIGTTAGLRGVGVGG